MSVLTAAELARRRRIELEVAAAHLAYFEQVGLAERVNGGYVPTDRGRELGGLLDEEARSLEVPLTDKDRQALWPRTGPARGAPPRELGTA